MFILTYMITGYNVENYKQSQNINLETVQTVALPVNNKTIVLDAGHGIPDERSAKQYTEQQKHKAI